MKYFYYTRWTFKKDAKPSELDGVGPYHSTWVTQESPQKFLGSHLADALGEFFIKQFDNEQEMRKYWNSLEKWVGSPV